MGKLLASHRYDRLILAAFRPWGDSAGAGRARLTRDKDRDNSPFSKFLFPTKACLAQNKFGSSPGFSYLCIRLGCVWGICKRVCMPLDFRFAHFRPHLGHSNKLDGARFVENSLSLRNINRIPARVRAIDAGRVPIEKTDSWRPPPPKSKNRRKNAITSVWPAVLCPAVC